MKINYSFSTQERLLIHHFLVYSFINSSGKYSASPYYVLGTRQGIYPVCFFPIQCDFWQHKRCYSELIFCLHTAVWLYQSLRFLSFLVLQASSVSPCQPTPLPAPGLLCGPQYCGPSSYEGITCLVPVAKYFEQHPWLFPSLLQFWSTKSKTAASFTISPNSCQPFCSPGHSKLCTRSKTFPLHTSGSQFLHFTIIE